jgi:phage terminase large subunit
VVKNKDSIKSGIDRIRELFKQNRLHIHKDCVNLISELETYSYPDKKPDSNEQENPIKEHDHALDALRYAIYMNSQGFIDKEAEIAERLRARLNYQTNKAR